MEFKIPHSVYDRLETAWKQTRTVFGGGGADPHFGRWVHFQMLREIRADGEWQGPQDMDAPKTLSEQRQVSLKTDSWGFPSCEIDLEKKIEARHKTKTVATACLNICLSLLDRMERNLPDAWPPEGTR